MEPEEETTEPVSYYCRWCELKISSDDLDDAKRLFNNHMKNRHPNVEVSGPFN